MEVRIRIQEYWRRVPLSSRSFAVWIVFKFPSWVDGNTCHNSSTHRATVAHDWIEFSVSHSQENQVCYHPHHHIYDHLWSFMINVIIYDHISPSRELWSFNDFISLLRRLSSFHIFSCISKSHTFLKSKILFHKLKFISL